MYYIRVSFKLIIILTIITGIIYPAITTLIIKYLFPYQAEGSLIKENGKIIGSELIGQNFTDPKYFFSRISATTPPYNAYSSTGSNLSTTNKILIDNVKARIDLLKELDPDNKLPIPVDLVTSSSSGLDPHISIEAAKYQVARIAKIRKIEPIKLNDLIVKYTNKRQFGILAEPVVNVLKLNLELDKNYPIEKDDSRYH